MRTSILSIAGFILLQSTTPLVAGNFSGQVFGLATAPNGDILVADNAVGIVQLDGTIATKSGFPLQGITDISPIGRGSFWVTRSGNIGTEDVGQALFRVSNGRAKMIVNLFEFERDNNPRDPGLPPESNPFDVQALGGEYALVADAAGNDLLKVSSEGHVEVLAIFPNALVSTANIKNIVGCPESQAPLCNLPAMMPAQPVPTSVAIGPDGYYYVGELKGFPAPNGESRVWRVAPWASWAQCGSTPDCEVVFDGGFTSIIDLAFGPEGLLYVVEFDQASWFAVETLPPPHNGGAITACDVETLECAVVASGLPLPTAITFGKNGSLWSTENGLIPGLASVVQIP